MISVCRSIAFPILISESASPVAVNVDLADHPIIDPNWNNDLGSRFEGACKIAAIGCDIVNNDRVAVSNSHTAYPLGDRNPHVLCRRAAERTEHKDAGILPVQRVESGPVVIS